VPEPDAYVSSPDSAVETPDSSTPVLPDAAVVEPDAAVVEPDAAVVEPDAAVVEPDAGVYVPEDSGVTPSPDAGPAADMEIIESDGPCNCPDGFKEEKRPMELLGSGCQMGGPTSGAWGGLLIIGLLGSALFLLRRSKALFGMLLVAGLLSASTAQAEPNLPASHLQPSVGSGDYYQTVSPSTLGHGKISLGAFYNYEHRPLQILWEDTGDRVTSVVRYRHNLDLLFAIGLGSRLEFGLGIPFVLGQGTRGLQYLNGPNGDAFDGGIGDLRVSAKLKALEGGPFALGLGASLVTPTASDANAFGQGGFSGSLALLMELSTRYFSVAANAGASLSGTDELQFEDQNVVSGSSFFGSLALKVPVWRDRLDLIGDAFMSMNLKEQDKEEIPFEILGGLRAHLGHGVTFDAGAGPGMTKGVGTPAFRVFAGFSWSPQPEKVKVKVIEKGCEECDKPVITRKVNIVIVKTKISVKLPELFPVFFATDEDQPLPQSIPVLEKNLKILKEHEGITKVVISGNCDWRASDEYNLDLGMRRATNIKKWFVDRGIDEKRLVVVSYGESKPKASNKTKAGMSQNRRVDMDIAEPKNGAMLKAFRQVRIIKAK
jgi:outer membrane protein OmpA-like peptidoglycan-associated protein